MTMKLINEKYLEALFWVMKGAYRDPGVRWTASIGSYRLTGWKEGNSVRLRTWYSTEEEAS